MKWFVKGRAGRPVRRQQAFRPRLESLEDRLTPSTLVGMEASPQPLTVPAQAVSSDHVMPMIQPMATNVSGGYVTGAAGSATAEGVAVGADGSVYTTGLLNDATVSPNQLAYVKKVTSSGTVAYFTLFNVFPDTDVGSTAEGTHIAVDSTGNAYVSGKAHHSTDSSDNGIYLKLDPTGGSAVYFFYQPGPGPVNTLGVTTDAAGDGVWTGQYSPDPASHFLLIVRFGPTGTETYGFYYTFGVPGEAGQGNADAGPSSGTTTNVVGWVNVPGTTGSTQNAFEEQVDATGMPLAGAILVSPTVDTASAVALDATGNSYVAGTSDIGGPTQTGVVAKVDPAISTVIWSTAPAGTTTTALTTNGVALTAAGDVVATGADSSGKAYLTKLTGSSGAQTDYTAFGGSGGADVGNAVAVRLSDGHILVAGTTNSSDFPVTDGSTLNGTTDGFLTEWTIP
jgi:hypothetical protein